MTTAAIATYAYDQIDQARTELKAISKKTTYEALKNLSRRWHGDMTDIVDRQ